MIFSVRLWLSMRCFCCISRVYWKRLQFMSIILNSKHWKSFIVKVFVSLFSFGCLSVNEIFFHVLVKYILFHISWIAWEHFPSAVLVFWNSMQRVQQIGQIKMIFRWKWRRNSWLKYRINSDEKLIFSYNKVENSIVYTIYERNNWNFFVYVWM